MIKLLCAVLLLTACRDEGIAQLMQNDLSLVMQADAEISPALQTALDKLHQCSKLAADTTADYLRHLRTDHFEKENADKGPNEDPSMMWPFEWPDRWVKVEMVCPTAKYSKRCRTTDWFHEHPEAITSDGKMKEPHARTPN